MYFQTNADDYVIRTHRLGMRQWKKGDTKKFVSMNQNKDVMKYFPTTLTADESKAFIKRMNKLYTDKGFCFFAVDELSKREFIGFIGLSIPKYKTDFTPCVEIGWRLDHKYWGNGYATEGARACLEYGLNDLNLTDIYSFTATTNTPSENVMKKIGLIKIGEFDHPMVKDGHVLKRHVLYKNPDTNDH